MNKLILFILLLLINDVFAKNCNYIPEDQPVLAGGRVKPYLVLAQESLKFLTGKTKIQDIRATEAFCQLSFSEEYPLANELNILVEHIETKKLLGLSDQDNSILAKDLLAKKDLLRAEGMQIKEENSFKKDINKTLTRVITLENIISQETLIFYNKNSKQWEPLSKHGQGDILKELSQSRANYIQDEGDRYRLELTYVKSKIFSIALLVALVGIFATVLLKNTSLGLGLSFLVILIETTGMTLRVLISGRAPITNMYETVMFSGYGCLIIAIVLYFIRKDKLFLLGGLGYNILCLFMMKFANNMLSSSISPLVPVLRDNFWLSTHVTTIILSYAALALSWMLANLTLFKMISKRLTRKDYRYYQDLTYSSIKVGVVLLAAGIILGGVWADYSWGRFWGWDPKETWSLIVLLFYMAILHARYTNWLGPHRFILLSAAGFMTVMMAWFGVNYILASGLHSYGFSEGGAIFLGSFFLVQTIIIAIGLKRRELKS